MIHFDDSVWSVRTRSLRALRPPPRLALSRWIESNIRLPEDVSALPGEVRLWPFQRDIADAISDPAIERVSLVKSVRVGLSTLLTATVGSFVANEPSPILLLLPTESDCRDYVVSDLDPIFGASPTLAGLLKAEMEGGRNTLLSRRFHGGSLKIVAARSPRNLRRHNVRVLLIDEADAMEATAEGSPITLAERRTLSFGNRKIIMGSTPTFEATSHVLRAYAVSDQRVFELPCPECGEFTEVAWRHIEWETDKPETAAFRCPHCAELIAERFKAGMVEDGRWRATRPEVTSHAGFRINALSSPHANASWAKLAAEFVVAKRSPDTLQTFVNTILAEGWKEDAEELDESELAGRVEPFSLEAIPAEVLILTIGVDVQRDRLEIVFLGHGRDETFVLGNTVIWGPSNEDGVWAELDEVLKGQWPHPNGGVLRVDAAAVDAGDGEMMDRVQAFTRARFGRRVVAIKGAAGNRPIISRSSAKGIPLFIVGVDGLKSQLTARLARGRSVRFSDQLEPRYFEELVSERCVVRYRRGVPVRQWERVPGKRAECLDSTIYALAARSIVPTNLDRRAEELASVGAVPAGPPAVIRSAWMERR